MGRSFILSLVIIIGTHISTRVNHLMYRMFDDDGIVIRSLTVFLGVDTPPCHGRWSLCSKQWFDSIHVGSRCFSYTNLLPLIKVQIGRDKGFDFSWEIIIIIFSIHRFCAVVSVCRIENKIVDLSEYFLFLSIVSFSIRPQSIFARTSLLSVHNSQRYFFKMKF